MGRKKKSIELKSIAAPSGIQKNKVYSFDEAREDSGIPPIPLFFSLSGLVGLGQPNAPRKKREQKENQLSGFICRGASGDWWLLLSSALLAGRLWAQQRQGREPKEKTKEDKKRSQQQRKKPKKESAVNETKRAGCLSFNGM